jgi:cysteinyl-tRNA synthetase
MPEPPPRFFNTRTRCIEPLETLEPGRVRMYTCGPTVYNAAHIGNFRAYVFEDLLQRHLEFRGYEVRRVMNLTDVDDKTIRGSRQAGLSLEAFTRPFKEGFFRDLDTLRIKRADVFPEATDPGHIGRMIAMIGTLVARGHAYQSGDGSVYFRIRSFPAYGALAHLDLGELKPGARVASDEYEKEEAGDFALWKAWQEEDGEVGWESPWGRGRPGWHIECSAMATGLLGDQLDIHCGGEDNIFPHHEAEIAQSECCSGLPFVRLWMHCRHLLVDGKKMAKSEGNFFTLGDLLAKGWTGREVRMALLAVKYREPLNFTFESLAAARAALERFDEWSRAMAGHAAGAEPLPLPKPLDPDAFGQALDDDLNISGALAALFDLIRQSNKLLAEGALEPGHARSLLAWRVRMDSVLALGANEQEAPPEIRALLERRASARAAKQWALSDSLRDEIHAAGWRVKDTREGQKISRGAAP